MTTLPSTSPQAKPLVVYPVVAQSIQTIQGLYYIAVGISAAFAVQMFQPVTGPPFDPSHQWPIRLLGLAVAAFGFALSWSGLRRTGTFVGGWPAMGVAVVLFCCGLEGVISDVLPPVCLIDTGLEFLFGCWWLAVIVHGIKTALPGASSLNHSPPATT